MKPSKNIDSYDFKGNDFQTFIQYLSSFSQFSLTFQFHQVLLESQFLNYNLCLDIWQFEMEKVFGNQATANMSNSTGPIQDDDLFSEIFKPKLSKTIFLFLSIIFTTLAVLLSLVILLYEKFGSDQVRIHINILSATQGHYHRYFSFSQKDWKISAANKTQTVCVIFSPWGLLLYSIFNLGCYH